MDQLRFFVPLPTMDSSNIQMYSTSILKRISFLQVFGASISLIASSTIVLVSRKKFLGIIEKGEDAAGEIDPIIEGNKICTPYRRILIGLSFADILQSLALLVGPFVPPKGTHQSPWAIGNITSCEIFGVFAYAGGLIVPLFNLLLSIYFLCKIKYKMTNEQFRQKIEKRMYTFIVLFVGGSSLTAVLTRNINPVGTGNACHMAWVPIECQGNPDIECERGGDHVIGLVVTYILTSVSSLLGIIVMMATICQHLVQRQSITSGHRNSVTRWCRFCELLSRSSERYDDETENMYLSRVYLSQMLIQAMLYAIIFFVTYVFVWIAGLITTFGNPVPTFVLYPMCWLYPCGGALNIFVLTRPKILALRSKFPELRWPRAFWLVLKAGGDLPKEEDVPRYLPRARKDPTPKNIVSSLGNSESSFAVPAPEDEDDNLDYVFCCWGFFYLKFDEIKYSDSEYSSVHSVENEDSNIHSHVPRTLENNAKVPRTSLRNPISKLEIIHEDKDISFGAASGDEGHYRQQPENCECFRRVMNIMDGADSVDFLH